MKAVRHHVKKKFKTVHGQDFVVVAFLLETLYDKTLLLTVEALAMM